jgi:membrane protease YdiL (CAAX protease family)
MALGPTTLLTALVWASLLGGRLLAESVGVLAAVLLSFSAATALVWRAPGRPAAGHTGAVRLSLVAGLGVLAGLALAPALLACVSALGGLLGLPAPARPPWSGPLLWIAIALLAPAFEEPLYRERWFVLLRERFGLPLALVGSSALFAAPHLEPSAVVGAFAGGLLLGAVRQVGRSLTLCAALHAGFNLATLVGTEDLPLGPLGLAALGAGALACAGALTRLGSREPASPAIDPARRAAYAAAGALVSVLLVVGATLLLREPSPPFWLEPRVPFDPRAAPAPPDYDRPESWAALPERAGLEDLVPTGLAGRSPEERRADAFFVHPTTFFSREGWNQPLEDEAASRLVDGLVLANQASVFSSCCRIHAPRYRQATAYAFLSGGADAEQARELAYGDVRGAFAHYLEHHGRARPIVIAGHSQGAYHALRLLSDFFRGRPLRERLVVAYLVGLPVPGDALAEHLPDIPVCRSPEETGCVASWNTVGPSADPAGFERVARLLFPRSAEGAPLVCVNPLTWTADARPAPAALNPGGVIFAREIEGSGVARPRVADARCTAGLLAVSRVADAGFARGRSGGDLYHLLDYGLFYLSVRRNAELRVARHREGERTAQRTAAPESAAASEAY